jgi:YD repeat-containing protein
MPRPARVLCAALGAALTVAVFPWGLGTAAAAATATLPPQGVYDSCEPSTSRDGCVSRLERLGRAGFRVVYNGSLLGGTSAAQVLAFAAAAHAAGLKLIWPLYGDLPSSDPHGTDVYEQMPALTATCACVDNQGLLRYVVGLARSRPNTWGYYLADEPRSDAHDRLATAVERVRALDPAHRRLVMGCGICPGGERNLRPFADLDATLGTDAYPVWSRRPDPRRAFQSVADGAASLHRVAAVAGREEVVTLQAWRWGDSYYDTRGFDASGTRFPSEDEIRAQRDAAVRHARPSLILWFTLYDVIGWEPGQRPWYWAQPPDPETRWRNLVRGALAPLPNGRPVARLRLRTSRGTRRWVRVEVDGRRSHDPDGRIVRFAWTVDGRRLERCRRGRCAFRVRRGRHRITLRVRDDRGATSAISRQVRIRRGHHRRSGRA